MDRDVQEREVMLVRAVLGDPYSGIGKPEPLNNPGPGVWSRRFTQEHRCVSLVHDSRVECLQGDITTESQPAQIPLQLLGHAGARGHQLLKFGRGQHEGVTAER